LLDIIGALNSAGRVARRLNGGQQQAYEDPDNRDHHQQFNQRESAAADRQSSRLEDDKHEKISQ
jgi:hypothetical protein